MATLKEVNAKIKTTIGPYRLVRGRGYYYLRGLTNDAADKVAGLYSTSIYTYSLDGWAVQDVIGEIERLLKQ